MDPVKLNPYPKKYKLPGYSASAGENLQEIDGSARKSIVHSLTFYEIPWDIDAKIDMLPSSQELDAIDDIQKAYLSFTVYDLKQMVAERTISAETAWSLFYVEWGNIKEVTEDNFKGMREAFYMNIEKRENHNRKLSLLEFEFYAKAGEAGLAKYSRYYKWSERLIFDEGTCIGMSEAVKDEYRKALWLEMRLIEEQVGFSNIYADIGKFIFNVETGEYRSQDNTAFKGSIDLFSKKKISAQSGWSIDSTIKAEMGHWVFDSLNCEGWVGELMDRMNITGYSENINSDLINLQKENLPPEANVFLTGGFYLQSEGKILAKQDAGYPLYPQEFPQERLSSDESHEIAEYVEHMIREQITSAYKKGRIKSGDLYKTYRKIGIYIALLSLEGKRKEEILRRLESFNVAEINEYSSSYKRRAITSMEKAFKTADSSSRGRIAKALIALKSLQRGTPEYTRLYTYQLIGEGKWDEIRNINRRDIDIVIPILRETLKDNNYRIRGEAANAIILIIGQRPDLKYEKYGLNYYQLDAYRTLAKAAKYTVDSVQHGLWDDVRDLGKDAIPSLEATLGDENFILASEASKLLIKIKRLTGGTEEYNQLLAYQLISQWKWLEVKALGTSAIPALEAASKCNNSQLSNESKKILEGLSK